MATATHQRLAAHHLIADFLVSLSGGGFHKKDNKDYIVLERKLGKSERDKNAVSLLREGISFMVQDFGFEQEARDRNLKAVRTERYNRLRFPTLALEDIKSNAEFFARLLHDSKLKAEYLQGYKISSSVSDQQSAS